MKYKAFISYRHSALSRAHALSLEAALKRYAKPLLQAPMRVFRDEQILTPGDDLPRTIRAALEDSEWLLLLAEKDSAVSPWVAEELRIWCHELGRAARLVIIHIADEIGVDAAAQRIDWSATNALPPALRDHLPALPIYADFTWAARDEERDLGNSRYRSLINGLVARIRGVTPESMMGIEVLTHRRNVRLRNGGITAIVISTVAAVVFGVLAVQRQWEAEDRSAFSRSQRLAAQSTVELQAGRLDLALLLGVEAFRPLEAMRTRGPHDAFDAVSALFQATHANPRLWTYLLRDEGLQRLGFSRDGRLLTLVAKDRVYLWDGASLTPGPALVAGPDERDGPIAAGQAVLAFLVEGRVVVADGNTREVVKLFATGQGGALDGPALGPDGAVMAVGAGDQSVFLWDMSTPRSSARILRGHTSNVVSLAFSPDGATLATGSWDGTARLWDAQSGDPRGVLSSGSRVQVEDVAYSPDGALLAVASGTSVFRWNPHTQAQTGTPLEHRGAVSSVAIHPDGTLIAAAGADSSSVSLWHLPSGERAHSLDGHASGLKQVAFSPDGAFLVALSHNGTVIVWRDVGRELPGEAYAGQLDEPRTLALGPGGEIAVGDCGERPARSRCVGGRISRLRYAAGSAVQAPRLIRQGAPLHGHPDGIAALAHAADGSALVSASCAEYASSACRGALVLRWGQEHPAPLAEFRLGADLEIGEMAFDAGGQVLAGAVTDRRGAAWSGAASDFEVWRWDARSGEPVGEPATGGDRLLTDLVFGNAEPRLLAAGSFDHSTVWRLDTGEQLFRIEGGEPVFDAGARSLITIRKRVFDLDRILVHDVATGSVVQEIVKPATGTIVSTALSSDGKLLALGDAEGWISLWHLGLSRIMGLPLRLHAGRVRRLAFGEDDRVLYSVGDEDGRVVALELDPARWVTRACRTVRRNLSHAEWVQFFGDEAYRLTCADQPVHPNLLEAGRSLAEAGDLERGVALMAQAAALGDPRVTHAPDEARALALRGYIERGERAATTGRVQVAIEHFRQALALDPDLGFDPAIRAGAVAAPQQVERAERLARLNRTDEALAAMDRAFALDARVPVSAETWYRLCRSGIVGTAAGRVAAVCDRAVELADGRQNYFAARAAAHAMRGDAAAAIADLEAYLAYEAQPMRFRGDRRDPPEAVERVRRRLDAFRAGDLRLSMEDIESLAAERR